MTWFPLCKLMWHINKQSIIFALILLPSIASAATYTVCASGCTGTSIQTVYNSASCGDTVEIHMDGSIDQTVTLNKNCTSGNEITIKNGTGHTPRLDLTATGYTVVVSITGNYNIWDGIGIYDLYNGAGMTINGDHNIVRNSNFDRIGYSVTNGTDCEAIYIYGNYNTISNNYCGDAGHGCFQCRGIGYTPRYNQILNNTFANRYGHAIGMIGSGAQYNLADGNDISHGGELCSGGASCGGKNAFQISGGSHNSFRRNIVHDVSHRAVEISAYSSVTNPASYNVFYNNTFYNITTEAATDQSFVIEIAQAAGNYDATNNTFINNIIAKGISGPTDWGSRHVSWCLWFNTGTDAGCTESAVASNDWRGNYLVNNIIRPYFDGVYQLNYAYAIGYQCVADVELDYTVTGVNGIGSMSGNITSDPWLGSEPNTSAAYWWYLPSGSPAIDAGVVVTDPNAATGGWAQLTYSGAAPDIGAYESNSTGSLSGVTMLGVTAQ